MANQEWAIQQAKKFNFEIRDSLLEFNLYVYRIKKSEQDAGFVTWDDIKADDGVKTFINIEKAVGDFTSEPGIIKCVYLSNSSRMDKGGYNLYDILATNSRPSFLLKTPIPDTNEPLLFRLETVITGDTPEETEANEQKLKTFVIESEQKISNPNTKGEFTGQRINLVEASKLSESLKVDFLENYEAPIAVKKIKLKFNKFTILNDFKIDAAATGVGTPTTKFPINVVAVNWNLIYLFPQVNGSRLDWFSEWAWEHDFHKFRSELSIDDFFIQASGDLQIQGNESYQKNLLQELYVPGNITEGSGIELAPTNLEPTVLNFTKSSNDVFSCGSSSYANFEVDVTSGGGLPTIATYKFNNFISKNIVNGNLMYAVNGGIVRRGDGTFAPGRKYGFSTNLTFNEYYNSNNFKLDFFNGSFLYKGNISKDLFSQSLQGTITKPSKLASYNPIGNLNDRKFFALIPVSNNIITSHNRLTYVFSEADIPPSNLIKGLQLTDGKQTFPNSLYADNLWSKTNVDISTNGQFHKLSDQAIAQTIEQEIEFEYAEELDIFSIDLRAWARAGFVEIEFIGSDGQLIRKDKINFLTNVNEQATGLKIVYNL